MAKLPANMIEGPDKYVPLMSAWQFLNIAGRYTGDPIFCAESVLNERPNMPDQVVSLNLSRAPTVLEAISEFVERANAATPGTLIEWAISGETFWILRRPLISGPADSWQVEQFVIAIFAKAFMAHLGRNWKMSKLKIRQVKLPEGFPNAWNNSEIETGSSITALGVRIIDIVNQTNLVAKLSSPESRRRISTRKLDDIERHQMQEAILYYISDGVTRMRHVAEAFGLTERTFRRRLSNAGFSYAELIDEARFRRAMSALNEPYISINTLAMELGYKHPENFTRAFRRRVGISPREFRRIVTRGDSAV